MGILKGKTIASTVIVLSSTVILFFGLSLPISAQDGSVAEQMQPQVQQTTQTAPTSPVPDDAYGIGTVAESLNLDGLNYWLFVIIAGIGSLIAWLGGLLFDLSLSAFTANMAALVEELGLEVAIGEMWTIVRDIFNLLFIFGLIYAGFRIILDANDSSSKKTIGTIVIAALIINFSLYFTQIVIDFTNVAAYQVHQMIVSGNSSQKYFGTIPIHNSASQFYLLSGLNEQRSSGGDSIRNEIGAVSGGKSPSDSSSPIGAIALGFIFLIFYSLLGFVFIASAVILITRFFALIFWMIFSPVLLLGMVLPKMQSQSDKWLQQFFNQALVGPVLIFMIYLSLRALQGLGGSGREPGLMATIIYLMVVIAFLGASLKVAKSFGAYGADRAMSIGQNMTKSIRGGIQGYAGAAAGGVAFGLAARGGRYFVGRRAQNYAESDAAKDAAANSWWGRRKLNLARKIGDASFDARNVAGAGKKLGLGSGIKGYKTNTEEIIKREKKYAESLGQVSDDDVNVKSLQSEVDFGDQVIKEKKRKVQEMRKSGEASQEEIDAAKADLEDFEEEHGNNKEKLQREKLRRQLGVTGDTRLSSYWDSSVVDKKTEIKNEMNRYMDPRTSEDDKGAIKLLILNKRQELAELEKKRDKATAGYANTVENMGSLKNFFLGRNKAQNEEAAKTIRDEYKKKVKSKDKDKPKEKEEKGDKDKGGDKEAA